MKTTSSSLSACGFGGKASGEQGYSLVETIVAMTIFGFIALGLTQNLVLTRGIAETNIRESTAITAVSGYMEQLKSLEYEKVLTSVRDNSVALPTVLSLGAPDPLYVGQWNSKDVVIDEDISGTKQRTMRLYVRPIIEDVTASGNGTILQMTLFYAWEDSKTGSRQDRALRTMRSYVPYF
jgi:prepilin-type N-terminal cleavage/methylation domain-containing protein